MGGCVQYTCTGLRGVEAFEEDVGETGLDEGEKVDILGDGRLGAGLYYTDVVDTP